MTITKDSSSLHTIRPYLPTAVSGALLRLDKDILDSICEIRLRKNAITTVTVSGKNYVLSLKGLTKDASLAIRCSKCDIDDFIYKFCQGSVFTHEDTIAKSFITQKGIRVGLGSTNSLCESKMSDITSVNIRLARHIPGCSNELYSHICQKGFYEGKGILIVSSPGVGKTTLLRDLAVKLTSGKNLDIKRVCVIDERNELYMENVFENSAVDFISGIDKCTGIERAVRLLSPEIIICDEISGSKEAEQITLQKNSGVIFIASYHSDTAEAALKKSYIQRMFDEGVFSHVYELWRCGKKICTKLSCISDD